MTVDIYPVGVLAAVQRDWREFRSKHGRIRHSRYEFGMIWRWAKQREWRSVKNCFNGYLAEPTPFPEHMKRCGSGWTKKRAMRSLERHGHSEA